MLVLVRGLDSRVVEQRLVEGGDRRTRVIGQPVVLAAEEIVLQRRLVEVVYIRRLVLGDEGIDRHNHLLGGELRQRPGMDVGEVGSGVAGHHGQQLAVEIGILHQERALDGDVGVQLVEALHPGQVLRLLAGVCHVDEVDRDALAGRRERGGGPVRRRALPDPGR